MWALIVAVVALLAVVVLWASRPGANANAIAATLLDLDNADAARKFLRGGDGGAPRAPRAVLVWSPTCPHCEPVRKAMDAWPADAPPLARLKLSPATESVVEELGVEHVPMVLVQTSPDAEFTPCKCNGEQLTDPAKLAAVVRAGCPDATAAPA